jgi:hypothetical protein
MSVVDILRICNNTPSLQLQASTDLERGGSFAQYWVACLAFHRARKEKEAWEAEERAQLLQQEKANMAAELQAMEDQANAAQHEAETHPGDGE